MKKTQKEKETASGMKRFYEAIRSKNHHLALQIALNYNLKNEIVTKSGLDYYVQNYDLTEVQIKKLTFTRVSNNPRFLNMYGQDLFLREQVKSFKIKELLNNYKLDK